jgi:hypothetical protein
MPLQRKAIVLLPPSVQTFRGTPKLDVPFAKANSIEILGDFANRFRNRFEDLEVHDEER